MNNTISGEANIRCGGMCQNVVRHEFRSYMERRSPIGVVDVVAVIGRRKVAQDIGFSLVDRA